MPEKWCSLNGYSTAATMGYYLWLKRFLLQVNPTYIVVCFDESLGSGFRHDIYKEYKANRALPDENIKFELLLCQELTQALGITTLASSEFEADDLIATLSHKARKKKQDVTIISSDKDLAQCVLGENDFLWDFDKGDALNKQHIALKMGVLPCQVPSFLALVGDVSDNIPGVPQLGIKTAQNLLSHYSNWQEIREKIKLIASLPIRRASFISNQIEFYKNQIDMSYELALARTNAVLPKGVRTKRKASNTKTLNELLIAGGLKK